MRLRPDLPLSLGREDLWIALYWACWLHDFGKAARGFQDRLRGGPAWPHRHEVLSLAFLDWFGPGLSEDQKLWIAAAIVSHHRDGPEIDRLYMSPDDADDDPLLSRLDEFDEPTLVGLWRWLDVCVPSWTASLEVEAVGIRPLAILGRNAAIEHFRDRGVPRLRHWLRAYRRFRPELARSADWTAIIGTIALRGITIRSDHAASAHVGMAGAVGLPSSPELLARLGIPAADLYDHQKASALVSGSVVLMAPTGAGKTEAALMWACGKPDDGSVPARLFYTLPFQASMNAMHRRLSGSAFPGKVGLEHGRSTLALYRRRLENDERRPQAARAARWEAQLARLNQYPVRVLSPYQLLKAPYRLRGYEALLSDLFGSACVLDEIHAYEPERLALILALVKYLRLRFEARFFVMSATLPGLVRDRLVDALGDFESIHASPELYASFQRHWLHVLPGELMQPGSLDAIAEAARGGKAVLVCCNTVRRAQLACHELQCRLSEPLEVLLLHGRFNGRDRLMREARVQQATGVTSDQRRPIVLVATQVVEVSLDIDLDTIYTDPAPLEALVQRFGRVNRRRRVSSAPVHVFAEPTDGQHVYEPALVGRAIGILARNSNGPIREDTISDWLNEVYSGEVADRWSKAFDQAYREFEAGCLRPLRAFASDERLEELFYRAFDSIEVLPAGLAPTFRELEEQDPLEASQLLVPIRWTQLARLRATGHVVSEGRPPVVAVPYGDFGLELP